MSVPVSKQERAQLRRKYRKQWSTKTGRPESDIYIPVALRDPEPDDTQQDTCADDAEAA